MRPEPTQEILVNGVSFTHADIGKVVDAFYRRVADDPVLKVPFSSVHDWPAHVARMTHFWWIRFGGAPYLMAQYNPVEKHFFAGFNADFLKRWLSLFRETVTANLRDDQSQFWALVTERMGHSLTIKNELYRSEYGPEGRQPRDDES
jgi:hemoglobin